MGFLLERHFWLIHAAVIAACATYSGRISARFLGERVASVVHPREAPARPAERRGGIVQSTLSVEIVSTMWAVSERRWSTALIREAGDSRRPRDSRLYFVGQQIEGTDAEIVRIDPRRVYVRRGDRFEYLDLSDAPPTSAAAVAVADPAPDALAGALRCDGDSCDADRAFVEGLLANPAPLFTQARFVPAMRDNRPVGMKVYEVRPGSLFARLGLADGDCITSINGIELTPAHLADAWVRLRAASHLRVSLDRAGRSRTLDYRIL